MKSERRRFSQEEKLAVIEETKVHGVRDTLEKHGIYPATYYNWKRKYDQMGEAGLQHSMTKEKLKRIGELEEEVDLLKKLLAEKEMESQLKNELLKKKYPKVKRKYS